MKHSRHSLIELTMARLKEFWREKEIVFWVFCFPVLLSVALGLAFRGQSEVLIRVAVLDVEGAAELAKSLDEHESIDCFLLTEAESVVQLRNGDVVMLVVPGNPHSYRYDPTRTESSFARLLVDDALQRGAGRQDLLLGKDDYVEQVGSRYIDFLIPGLLGLNIMGSGMWGVGFAVVSMRAGKLLKRFLASPMRKSDFLLSFLLSRLVFLLPEVICILGAGYLIFGVEIQGSILSVLLVALVGCIAFSGLGLLCGTRIKTVEGAQGMLNLVMLPMWIFSGVFFSTKNFPEFMQPVLKFLPLTALNDAIRAIMLDGASLASTAGGLMIVVAWGVIPFFVALKIFRWN